MHIDRDSAYWAAWACMVVEASHAMQLIPTGDHWA